MKKLRLHAGNIENVEGMQDLEQLTMQKKVKMVKFYVQQV